MSTVATSPAVQAIVDVVDALVAAGIDATRDAGAFYPQPVGVLVGLPDLVSRGQGSFTFTVPVHVVSGDPLSSTFAVDRLYGLADAALAAVREAAYRVDSFRPAGHPESLPALTIDTTVLVPLAVPVPATETEEP